VVAVHDGPLDGERTERLVAAGVDDVLALDADAAHRTLTARRVLALATAGEDRRGDEGTRSGGSGDAAEPALRGPGPDPVATDGSGVEEPPLVDTAGRADDLKRDRRFLYAFHAITTDPESSFDDQVRALLELCCDALGFDVGMLSRVSGNDYEIRAVHAPGEHLSAGETLDVDGSPCGRAIATASVEWFLGGDSGRQSYVDADCDACLAVPVRVGDDLYGTLCLSGPERRDTPGDAEVAFARLVSKWVGSELLRSQRERKLAAANDRFESLVEATPLAIVGQDAEGTVTRWNAGAEAMFGYDAEEMLDGEYPLVPPQEAQEAGELLERTFAGESLRGVEIRRRTRSGDLRDLRLSTAPIRDATGEIDEAIGLLDDVTDRREFERKLRALQETTNALNVAVDAEEVTRTVVEAVSDVLDHPFAAFWRYDGGENRLVPGARSAAADERFDRLPSFGPGDGRLWEVYESGGHRQYDDVSAVDPRYEGIRSGISVPLGEYGVLGTGTATAAEFDEKDLELVRILASAAEAALHRADRERRLRETNERLDEFASVVAHDLRTPLTSAVGYLDIGRETGSEEHFDRVEAAHDRMDDLIEDLLALARTTDRTPDRRETALEEVVAEAWSYVDTDAVTLETGDLGTLDCDPGQVGRLFENLFRNAFEHGDADTVRVEALDGGGFAVEDDGDGFDDPPDADLFERGHTSGEGIGFGLAIVADVASAHGWSVAATTGRDGGARFEVTVP
jgi:PAS domain S-box-containing protein